MMPCVKGFGRPVGGAPETHDLVTKLPKRLGSHEIALLKGKISHILQ